MVRVITRTLLEVYQVMLESHGLNEFLEEIRARGSQNSTFAGALGSNGKESCLVRPTSSHRAGLHGLTETLQF